MKFDFSGYATKNDLKCSDGRTIKHGAFAKNHGTKVPLVWNHLSDDPGNVLGHAMLEERPDGTYATCFFNDSDGAKNAKEAIRHKDINALSIYANQLVQVGMDVLHGAIREVSLVLAGANPGATIDNIAFAHSGGGEALIPGEAVIYTGLTLEHAEGGETAPAPTPAPDGGDETVKDVFDTMNEKQKKVCYFMIGEALKGDEVKQSAITPTPVQHSATEGSSKMTTHNVFEANAITKATPARPTLTHSQLKAIVEDAHKCGSFKESFLAHAVTYGIENIEYLFPDAKLIRNSPDWIARRMEWVAGVLGGSNHSPFSRIKSMTADITLDTARAKGYIKGNMKKEEFFKLAKRVTAPCTIYKKQKLDRDDMIDITDLDVVAWLKAEMRLMLDEELARQILIGDGREADDDDKINEDCIRPVWTDDDLYSHKIALLPTADTEDTIEQIIRSRTFYKGSGNPVFYTVSSVLTDMLLLKDTTGRRIYSSEADLAAALRVSRIVEVPVMEGATRIVGAKTHTLVGIILNIRDYTIGADKGGAINMFDDFDIDYNQYKYLIETRCSGALTLPKSAVVIEVVAPTTP